MPTIECASCGAQTNTSCSNHLFPTRTSGKANECYCRYVNGRWETGCGWNKLSAVEKKLYSTLLPKETP